MLGQHKLLEQRLRRKGTAALATVVEVESRHTQTQSTPAGVGYTQSLVHVRLRVEPEGEEPFEARTDAWMVGSEGATEGMVVPVLYDPSDHDKLVIDQRKESWAPADSANAGRRRAERAAARGEDPARTAAIEAMREAAKADPDGFRQTMQKDGPAAFGLPGMPAPPVVAPQPADPLDRLAKLADLHDRGALTDEEFEEQKRRLLSD